MNQDQNRKDLKKTIESTVAHFKEEAARSKAKEADAEAARKARESENKHNLDQSLKINFKDF